MKRPFLFPSTEFLKAASESSLELLVRSSLASASGRTAGVDGPAESSECGIFVPLRYGYLSSDPLDLSAVALL